MRMFVRVHVIRTLAISGFVVGFPGRIIFSLNGPLRAKNHRHFSLTSYIGATVVIFASGGVAIANTKRGLI